MASVIRAVPCRQDDLIDPRQQRIERQHSGLAGLDDPIHLGKLRQAYCVLGFVHAVVVANTGDPQGRPTVYITKSFQLAHFFSKDRVIGGDGPPLAEQGHVLVALKAVARRQAAPADWLALVQSTDGMGGIINDRNTGFSCDAIKCGDMQARPLK